MHDSQHFHILICNQDLFGYVFNFMKNPLGQHFARSEYRFPPRRLQGREFRAFRIGVKFVNVEKKSRQLPSPTRLWLLNLLLCSKFLMFGIRLSHRTLFRAERDCEDAETYGSSNAF
jgi:hypothetical protein